MVIAYELVTPVPGPSHADFKRHLACVMSIGSASVTPSEFRLVCRDLGIIMTEIEAVAVYGAADVNGDGSMSFHEFLAQYMGEVSALGKTCTLVSFIVCA